MCVCVYVSNTFLYLFLFFYFLTYTIACCRPAAITFLITLQKRVHKIKITDSIHHGLIRNIQFIT